MTDGELGSGEDGTGPGWVYSARDGRVHAVPLEDSECGRWPLAVCAHTAPPTVVAARSSGPRCAVCVLRVSTPGTGRRHHRVTPAGAFLRVLARWRTRHVAVSLISEFPVIALPYPALRECDDRVFGTAGSGSPAPGLVPPCPVPPRAPR